MAIKIGVISDTHGLLRPEVTEVLNGCDRILHGGDVNRPELLNRLRAIAPLYVVRGNNDREWAEALPRSLTCSIGGVSFFMVHNRREIPADLGDAQVVVFNISSSGGRGAFGSIPAAAGGAGFTRRSPWPSSP